MRFIVFGLQRTGEARCNETPMAGSDRFSYRVAFMYGDEGKGDDEGADQQTAACFLLKCDAT
jgi:hypothetical protein